jgi:TrmH family RNA methyltransferase
VLRRNIGTIRSAVPLAEFCSGLGGHAGKKIAVLFGREGIGLNEREIGMCDTLVHIEADREYPVLNLSHAMAVVLYGLRMAAERPRKTREERMCKAEKEALTHMFKMMVGRYKVRNREKCKVAFARVLARANPTKKEGNALLNIFRLVAEELEGKERGKVVWDAEEDEPE